MESRQQFKENYLCIPLRFGVQATAYPKLVTNILLYIIVMVVENGLHSPAHPTKFWKDSNVWNATIFSALEIAINIVLVIGILQKRLKLLQVVYYYSLIGIGYVGVLTIFYILSGIYLISYLPASYEVLKAWAVGAILVAIFNYILMICLIPLLRREIRSLQKSNTLENMPIGDNAEDED